MKFEDIYKHYYRDVYYFLLSLSGDPELAEELTQETFYRALKNIHKFKGECQLRSWLCQIGRNAYLSWVKKRKHLTADMPEPEKLYADGAGGEKEEHDPELLCIRKDEALSVYKILHLLSEPYKEVFTLRALGELTYKEDDVLREESKQMIEEHIRGCEECMQIYENAGKEFPAIEDVPEPSERKKEEEASRVMKKLTKRLTRNIGGFYVHTDFDTKEKALSGAKAAEKGLK